MYELYFRRVRRTNCSFNTSHTMLYLGQHSLIYRVIEIGIAAHHMLQANGADYLLYQRKLTKLGPILGQLSRISRVIWLNQYPTFDIYGHNSSHNTDVHSEKLEAYNKVIRHVLR